jgi:predicted TIM-barrel fold metal-dependent hydrolase
MFHMHSPPDLEKPGGRNASWLRKTLIALGLLIVMLLAARWILFAGAYLPREPAPNAGIIDLHCHTAGIGGGDSGCFISKRMRDSYKFDIYLRAFGTDRAELESKGDALLVDRIAAQVGNSRRVEKAVVLAMDGVIDARGELDRSLTEVYVPNEFIAAQVARHTNLLFGASINPNRPDALARLDWCAARGAVLVKWIPSVMHVDPSDERLVPFYQRLVELRIPLLSHTGQERSFTDARDELCDPARLRLPLKMGVTVIAAHIASTGSNQGQRDTDRLKPLMLEFTNLWSELSSLTQVNKLGYLREALTAPEFQERILYGSDFPLMNTALVSPWFYPLHLTHGEMQRISELPNAWDRDIALKEALGVPARLFTRSSNILRIHPAAHSNPAP